MKYVYLLEHLRVSDDAEHNKTIGIYSSEDAAKAAVDLLKRKPGFADYPEGFNIDRYEVDKTFWESGFG